MKSDYGFHDRLYRQRRMSGAGGWATEEDVQEFLALLECYLSKPHVPARTVVLELGCGEGRNVIWLAHRGWRVVGVDIAPTAIDWARDLVAGAGIDADPRVGTVLDLDGIADGAFDLVLDGHCAHCIIGDDRPMFFAEAFRVLRPGGIFHLHTMCGRPGKSMERLFDPESRCLLHEGGVASRYIGRAEDIVDEVKRAGFEIVLEEIVSAKDDEDCDDLVVHATKA